MSDYSVVTLRTASGCELDLVPEFGGLINRLQLRAHGAAHSVIAGLPNRGAMQADRIYRGVPLFPFANRIDQGRYSHRGQSYQLPINEPERNNALHGFLHHIKPRIDIQQSEHGSDAFLHYAYDGSVSGYPFCSDIIVQYALREDSYLEVTFTVHNRHAQPIPVGIGWHPYFTLGCAVDDLALQLPQVKQVLVDQRLLPTGEQREFTDYSQLATIGKTPFDTCFAIQSTANASKAKTTLWSESQNLGLELWQQTGERGCNFLQLCIAPDRQSIAFEPVSCGINAFNTGEGLIVLAPNERFSTRMGVRILTQRE